MPEESIQVVPSEEGGNGLPPETPTAPSVPTEPVVPPVEEPAKPAEPPVVELFELPDGRKVEPSVLVDEYKNLLSDYTRKSQALAAREPLQTPAPTVDPEWQPQSYDELLKVAETRILQSIEARENARIQEQQQIENAVVEQLAEIKKTDATLNENALFQHAMKYGFRDLSAAHQNMKDMSELAKKVQATTANNIAKRNDAVSVVPGASGARPDPSHFSNAVDYMRSLK